MKKHTTKAEPKKTTPGGGRPLHEHGPGVIGRLRTYLLAGILVTAPISITIWLTWNIVVFVDDTFRPLIPERWNPDTYLPFSVPGLGVILIVVLLIILGMLTAGFLGRALMRQAELIMDRVPVLSSIYGATKQIFETVLSTRSQVFRQVALVEYPNRGTWAVGFVTGTTTGEVQRLTDEQVISVFVPATPNPTTGFLLFLPRSDVHILDMTVEQGLKLVISGGIVVPHEGERPGQIQLALQAKPERKRVRLSTRLRNYFVAGILVAAPVAITFWLAWEVVTFVDNRVTPYIPAPWNPETYLPFAIPGLGLVVVAVGLILVGMLAYGLLGRALTRASEWAVSQLPIVRSIYSALKQIVTTVLSSRSEAFRECVLFQYPRKGSWAIGFITGKTEGHVQEITDQHVVNVFLPTTPNPTSGFLLFVPATDIVHLTMTVEEGLKMVVSGGIVVPPDRSQGAEDPAAKGESVDGGEGEASPGLAKVDDGARG